MGEPPEHWSFSQWQTFTQCGWQYKLERVDRIPTCPSVAAVGGSALHSWTEMHDLGYTTDWDGEFDAAIENQRLRSPDFPPEEWRVFGRVSKQYPERENIDAWRTIGLEMTERYTAWRTATDTRIADDLYPDEYGSTFGVEYQINVDIPGVGQLVGAIDRLEYDEDGALVAIDIKTGRIRHTAQLVFYAAAARLMGLNIQRAGFWSARTGALSYLQAVPHWDPDRLRCIMEHQADCRNRGIYPPTPGDHCGICSVRQHCNFAV